MLSVTVIFIQDSSEVWNWRLPKVLGSCYGWFVLGSIENVCIIHGFEPSFKLLVTEGFLGEV